jgi:tetratricopeptide (TPR) repeat protein
VEELRPDVEVYDVRQNIFFIPAKKAGDKEGVTGVDLYQFVRKMAADQKPVYFTNPIFGNFRFAEHGVLYRAIPGGETPDSIEDPWEKYDLSGLDNVYLDSYSKEIVGKYFFTRARHLWKTNQKDLSGDFLEKALSAAGDRHLILKHISIFYMQTGRSDRAGNLLKKAVKLNPFDSDNYNMLAMIAHYKSDHKEALIYYDKALELRGNSISVLMNRAVLYEQMGDKEANPGAKKDYYQKAYNDLEQSEKIEPSNPVIANLKKRISLKLSR